jgi:prolyl-tRNA editing enzyme YbaK/EbsC (Cys-tRNA(Pro) deacylase)
MEYDRNSLPRACRLVDIAARTAGLAIEIRQMSESTRTAEEAAAACGCSVGQIVKSLVFQGKESGRPILLLVSGSNRVKENLVAREIGEKILRPDAEFVRNATGFAIGGIPPLGHAEPLRTYFDADLLKHPTVFAAAGTPNAIFAVDPAALLQACGAQAIAVHD